MAYLQMLLVYSLGSIPHHPSRKQLPVAATGWFACLSNDLPAAASRLLRGICSNLESAAAAVAEVALKADMPWRYYVISVAHTAPHALANAVHCMCLLLDCFRG